MNALAYQTFSAPVEFAEFTGIEYLLIDIASNYGLDKSNWETRLDWALCHENNMLRELERMQENPDYRSQYLYEADEPALFFAGLQALSLARQGKPVSYPISLDATASGLQILAILSGCEKSARACNVIPSSNIHDDREDAYTNHFNIMRTKVANPYDVTRAQAKDALMTALYGSTAVPKRHFGTGDMLEAFYETCEQELPGAWSLNLALKSFWQSYALSHDWVLPDNFHVHIKEMNPVQKFVQFMDQPVAIDIVVNKGTKEGLSLCPNLIHSIDGMIVREMQRRCDYDVGNIIEITEAILSKSSGTRKDRPQDQTLIKLWQHYKNSGFLSARVLSLIDRENIGLIDIQPVNKLISSLPLTSFHIITVHDCFRCLPNYGNDLRRQYNQILSELAASDLLSYLIWQVTGNYVSVTKGCDLSQEILLSNYSLS